MSMPSALAKTNAAALPARAGVTVADQQVDVFRLAETLAKSGYFADSRDAAQCCVRILAGQELGFGPVASMTGVNIIKGRVTVSANLLAAAVQRSGRWDYRVKELTDTNCVLTFLDRGEPLGESSFSMQDAAKAGLAGQDNYRKFPRNMLFSRALSNGVKLYCPAIYGGPLYTPDELGADVDGETGELIAPPVETPSANGKQALRAPEPEPTKPAAEVLPPTPAAQPALPVDPADALTAAKVEVATKFQEVTGIQVGLPENKQDFRLYLIRALNLPEEPSPWTPELLGQVRDTLGDVPKLRAEAETLASKLGVKIADFAERCGLPLPLICAWQWSEYTSWAKGELEKANRTLENQELVDAVKEEFAGEAMQEPEYASIADLRAAAYKLIRSLGGDADSPQTLRDWCADALGKPIATWGALTIADWRSIEAGLANANQHRKRFFATWGELSGLPDDRDGYHKAAGEALGRPVETMKALKPREWKAVADHLESKRTEPVAPTDLFADE